MRHIALVWLVLGFCNFYHRCSASFSLLTQLVCCHRHNSPVTWARLKSGGVTSTVNLCQGTICHYFMQLLKVVKVQTFVQLSAGRAFGLLKNRTWRHIVWCLSGALKPTTVTTLYIFKVWGLAAFRPRGSDRWSGCSLFCFSLILPSHEWLLYTC